MSDRHECAYDTPGAGPCETCLTDASGRDLPTNVALWTPEDYAEHDRRMAAGGGQ